MGVNLELHGELQAGDGLPLADHFIDITSKLCPMTFVHTRLALDRLAGGQVLEVRLAGAEALRNVPASCVEQGHAVLGVRAGPGEASTLFVRKKGGAPGG